MFNGFGPQVFEWFAGLEQDNSREYFGSTRDFYEEHVRGELQSMLEELSEPFGGEVKMFRQHRDLRFTADKSPYKTRTYGVVYGGPAAGAGLYCELSARGLYAGTGYYQLDRDQLDRFRSAVADDATGTGPGRGRCRGRGGRARDQRRGSSHGAARISPRPRADPSASTQGPDSGPPPRERGRDRALRRARPHGGDLGRGGADQRLARGERRAGGPAERVPAGAAIAALLEAIAKIERGAKPDPVDPMIPRSRAESAR